MWEKINAPEQSVTGGFFMDYRSICFIILLILLVVFLLKLYFSSYPRPHFSYSRLAARVGIFGALASVLYVVPVFSISLPFLPPFLSLHFDEVPVFIAAFAYGPWTGMAVLVIKTLIKLPFTSTLCVGELADFLFSAAFILPAAFIYQKKRNLKGVGIGFAVGTICQLVVSMVLNVYAMLPFYMFVMGLSYETILGMCQAVNPAITDLSWPYAFMAVLPLNLIKDAAVIVLTFLIYRSIGRLLHYEGDKKRRKSQ